MIIHIFRKKYSLLATDNQNIFNMFILNYDCDLSTNPYSFELQDNKRKKKKQKCFHVFFYIHKNIRNKFI